MSNIHNNLCDDWGWYVDMEISGINIEKKQSIIIQSNKYYTKNGYDNDFSSENDYDIYNYLDNITTKNTHAKTILNIGTTIIITIILSYMMSFPLNLR